MHLVNHVPSEVRLAPDTRHPLRRLAGVGIHKSAKKASPSYGEVSPIDYATASSWTDENALFDNVCESGVESEDQHRSGKPTKHMYDQALVGTHL